MTKTPAFLFLCSLSLGPAVHVVSAQTPLNQRVLVVYNSKQPESLEVARYYMRRRAIPESHRCAISVASPDAVKDDEFDSRVKFPIRRCLEQVGKQRILYIVFSYATPFLLDVANHHFSLDQAVADVWDEYVPGRTADLHKPQPYFGDAESQGDVYIPFISLAAWRARPGARNIYSVWRLDAANPGLAKGLVDKALAVAAHGLSGNACFDRRSGAIASVVDDGYGSGEWDIHQAAEFARQAGFRVTEDELPPEFGTPPAPARCDDAALYAGWYSVNHYNDAFSWAPGAIGFHLDSFSVVHPRGGTNWVANAVLKGITVTSGAVAEPLLIGLPHPDQIFFYLFQGANVGDSVLRATRWLKWMILNIGDPLYRPFPRGKAPFNSAAYNPTLLALVPQTLVGGTPSSVFFHFPGVAPQAGAAVAFKSDRPELVGGPARITVPAKMDHVTFPITTHPVPKETVVRISVSVDGVTKSNTLVLYPPSARK